ncbi:unnamed protein product [Microthlaspi erraticum]|uniref:Uncharacterized protein n=1 Tax=Microthlaspi erraticum TaxID=1685480 RepID=A0A6D2HXV2_9BRAS|nr:unnamed protein product [Microthlaspi erraticum]
MIHLFSFLFTLSLITSFFTWRAISLLLNKVHSNLKLPLLTLTTNGSFLFLVLLSSLNLSLSDLLRVDISLCIRFFHPLIILFKSACILSLLSLALLDSPSTILLCEARFPHCLSSLLLCFFTKVPEMHQRLQRIRVVMIGLVNSTLSSIESKNSSDKLDRAG